MQNIPPAAAWHTSRDDCPSKSDRGQYFSLRVDDWSLATSKTEGPISPVPPQLSAASSKWFYPSRLCSRTCPKMPSVLPASGLSPSTFPSAPVLPSLRLVKEWHRIPTLRFHPLIITSIKVALGPGPPLARQHISARTIERQQGPALNYWYQHN